MYHNYVIGIHFDVLELSNPLQFQNQRLYLRVHLYIDKDFVEIAKIAIFERFYDGLERQNPGGHWWKWERLKKGTLEKELSDLNISNRIYNQTFISFIFRKNIKIKIITSREK